MSHRQLPEPAEISSLRLAGHWMRHTLTGWLATEVVPVLAGCRLPDRGMEALHGASRLWAADLEGTIGVPNHTYAKSIRISTLPYFQSAYICMQHNKWSKSLVTVPIFEFWKRFDLKLFPNSAGQPHEQDAEPECFCSQNFYSMYGNLAIVQMPTIPKTTQW